MLAWHTVAAIHIIASNTNLTFEAPSEDWPIPTTTQFIADSYQQASDAFVQALKTQWIDKTIRRTNRLFGSENAKWVTLNVYNNIKPTTGDK